MSAYSRRHRPGDLRQHGLSKADAGAIVDKGGAARD